VGEILDDRFQLRNHGTAPLEFSLTVSCGCSDLSPRAGTIPPGEAQDVHIGVELKEEGTEKILYVGIASNDPTTPKATYVVKAYCTSPLVLTPKTVNFGQVLRGQTPRIDVKVTDENDQPLDAPGGLVVKSGSPYVCCESRVDDAKNSIVSVILAGEAPSGWLSERINLRLAGQDRSVELFVVANILDAIAVAPTVLDLEPGARRSIITVWRPDGGPLGRLTKVDAPAGVSLEALGSAKDRRRRFEVRAENVVPGTSGAVGLTFEDTDRPATFRFRTPITTEKPLSDVPRAQPTTSSLQGSISK
jgi:hypothetical protein